jgi:hypothetical protein
MKFTIFFKTIALGFALVASQAQAVYLIAGGAGYHIDDAMVATSTMLRGKYLAGVNVPFAGCTLPDAHETLELITRGQITINDNDEFPVPLSQNQLELLLPIWQEFAQQYRIGGDLDLAFTNLRTLSLQELDTIATAANYLAIEPIFDAVVTEVAFGRAFIEHPTQLQNCALANQWDIHDHLVRKLRSKINPTQVQTKTELTSPISQLPLAKSIFPPASHFYRAITADFAAVVINRYVESLPQLIAHRNWVGIGLRATFGARSLININIPILTPLMAADHLYNCCKRTHFATTIVDQNGSDFVVKYTKKTGSYSQTTYVLWKLINGTYSAETLHNYVEPEARHDADRNVIHTVWNNANGTVCVFKQVLENTNDLTLEQLLLLNYCYSPRNRQPIVLDDSTVEKQKIKEVVSSLPTNVQQALVEQHKIIRPIDFAVDMLPL